MFGRRKPPPYVASRDRTPTNPIPAVGVVRPTAPRTAPIPLPSTYANALPPELEPTAELFTLHAQGRLGVYAVKDVLCSVGLWSEVQRPPADALFGALAYLRAWESHYAPLMEGPCPPGMTCPEGPGLCPWHRKTLRRWFDRLHPVVRAAASPATFATTVAPLLTDLPAQEA